MCGAPPIVPEVGSELLCLPRVHPYISYGGLKYRPASRAVSRTSSKSSLAGLPLRQLLPRLCPTVLPLFLFAKVVDQHQDMFGLKAP